MFRVFVQLFILFIASCFCIKSFSATSDSDSINFIVFSDMHLDTRPNQKSVIINPPENTYKTGDIDIGTFQKIIDKIPEANLLNKYNPNFLITLGDINAHKSSSYHDYKQKNLYTAFNSLSQTFPNVPIYNVFGNNDSPDKDYGVYSKNGNSPYNTLMSQSGWKNGFLSSGTFCSDDSSTSSYPCINIPTEENKKYGYFTGYLQNGLKLIALNSVLFSSSQYSPSHDGADLELTWLNTELQKSMAHHENVIIVMHIPVGNGWLDQYNAKFSTIISKIKPGVIIGMLAGHTHMNELRLVRLVNAKRKTLDVFPLIIIPAFSPSDNNAPGFEVVTIKKTNNQWAIQNITAYSYQQKQSTDNINLVEYYQFNDSYCPGETLSVSACLLKNLGYSNKSFIKPPASDLMSEHYTNGNLNYTAKVASRSWIRRYEVQSQS